MRIQKNTSSILGIPKSVMFSLATALIIAVASFTYVYAFGGSILGWSALNSSTQIKKANTADDQKKAGDIIKESSANQSTSDQKSNAGSDQPASPSPIPGSNKKGVDVTITAAAQNGSTLQIRSLIYIVTDSGTCTLSLEKPGQPTLTKTADVQAFSSSSSCQGFDIPVAELPTGGAWQASLTFDSNQYTGTVTKTVDITK